MARIAGQCPSCGQDAEWRVSESIAGYGEMVWSRAITCPNCGLAIEEDSQGLPPPREHAALIDEQGLWSVRPVNESDRVRSVAVLRPLVGLGLKAAGELLRAADAALWSGTRVECLWLKQHLKGEGIEAELLGPAGRE